MEFVRTRFDTLDDLQHHVLAALLKKKATALTASRGATRELQGALLELTNPRARLSRSRTRGTIFSCLGEALWYFAASDKLDFISYYIADYREESSDGVVIKGAYGPRIFGGEPSQFATILRLLATRDSSRRAVIQIFEHKDLENQKEVPCTTSLQFFVRASRVDLIAVMRSNDAYKGLPHDIFSFTMIQEVLARSLGLEIGTYRHFVGSLHLYENDVTEAQAYISEGLQQRISMPPMPSGDPMPAIRSVLDAERMIRSGIKFKTPLAKTPYWRDIITLLRAYKYSRTKNHSGLARMRLALKNSAYNHYIDTRIRKLAKAPPLPTQSTLPFASSNTD
ncbi:thymidylate synthase [Pseudoxanthomonas winnipegensis]|uniref:thymidylate synthase n=1 Tax=Pseudoxanthomonas winnipegensis TaxID=2480810 RepID=A0A4Q8LS06_9GAMM|nr:thymidylate synthase [Pseudoxanthomonas winnipegensis]TAA34430.1 thymidylate synthase [Pseudoxanthomonas winnipegensis]